MRGKDCSKISSESQHWCSAVLFSLSASLKSRYLLSLSMNQKLEIKTPKFHWFKPEIIISFILLATDDSLLHLQW